MNVHPNTCLTCARRTHRLQELSSTGVSKGRNRIVYWSVAHGMELRQTPVGAPTRGGATPDKRTTNAKSPIIPPTILPIIQIIRTSLAIFAHLRKI
ncbi:hypothetical protein TcasGA2_TC007462 [Tribolium castaneum]|uniref:Uncharacterized protein n=1 Tax=Tribolium castaneum TaxID=7070 RepID=D1ZZF7_TRICA|nr:hypothetical protein TcasGA2_TC007462 [Tribolium castaneum]